MKKKLIFTALILGVVTLAGCSYNAPTQSPSGEQNTITTNEAKQNTITTTTNKKEENYPLTQTEIDGIMQMREEEKLARDVYLYLYEKWQLPIFNNIAASEQQHMEAMKTLIDTYSLDDPIKQNEIGSFTNETISKLYNELTTQGGRSLADALTVGAKIEELDIRDINNLIEQTNKTDIINVYENLMKGSRNHLRAFMKNIDRLGLDYTPEYLSPSEFNKIIQSDIEKGPAK